MYAFGLYTATSKVAVILGIKINSSEKDSNITIIVKAKVKRHTWKTKHDLM